MLRTSIKRPPGTSSHICGVENCLIFGQVHTDWPSYLHSKGVFFVKRSQGSLPKNSKQPLLDHLTCGDVHPNILGQANLRHRLKIKDIAQIISVLGWRKSSFRYFKIRKTDRNSLTVYLRVNIEIFSPLNL